MPGTLLIPLFPLSLLPLPGELVPLHIFEPRYKQLLIDAETMDISFGIFLNHACNVEKLGALMKLESVIKRYPGGESDIILRCTDIFSLEKLYQHYTSRLYPGGDIRNWKIELRSMPGDEVREAFLLYQGKRKINHHFTRFTLYQVACELNLDVTDRYKMLILASVKRETFLLNHLKFQLHVMRQEERSKEVFHLN